jgi:hypothetical protein
MSTKEIIFWIIFTLIGSIILALKENSFKELGAYGKYTRKSITEGAIIVFAATVIEMALIVLVYWIFTE